MHRRLLHLAHLHRGRVPREARRGHRLMWTPISPPLVRDSSACASAAGCRSIHVLDLKLLGTASTSPEGGHRGGGSGRAACGEGIPWPILPGGPVASPIMRPWPETASLPLRWRWTTSTGASSTWSNCNQSSTPQPQHSTTARLSFFKSCEALTPSLRASDSQCCWPIKEGKHWNDWPRLGPFCGGHST